MDGKKTERLRLAEALRANLKRRKAPRPAREAEDKTTGSPKATLGTGPAQEGERG